MRHGCFQRLFIHLDFSQRNHERIGQYHLVRSLSRERVHRKPGHLRFIAGLLQPELGIIQFDFRHQQVVAVGILLLHTMPDHFHQGCHRFLETGSHLHHFLTGHLIPVILVCLIQHVVRHPLFFVQGTLLFLSGFLQSGFQCPSRIDRLQQGHGSPVLGVTPLKIQRSFYGRKFPVEFQRVTRVTGIGISAQRRKEISLSRFFSLLTDGNGISCRLYILIIGLHLFTILLQEYTLLGMDSQRQSQHAAHHHSSIHLNIVIKLEKHFLSGHTFLLFIHPVWIFYRKSCTGPE